MKMKISTEQQNAVLRQMGYRKLNRHALADAIGISYGTVKTLLDAPTPVHVQGRTFTAVNDWLISELAK